MSTLCHISLQQAASQGQYRRPWVAFLPRLDKKYGFARQFLEPISKSYDRKWTFSLAPGCYELSERTAEGVEKRGFIEITEDGDRIIRSRAEIFAKLEPLEASAHERR